MQTGMQAIRDGIKQKHTPGEVSDFATAVYDLFDEFKRAYQKEWARIDDCEKIYQGDHWHDIPVTDKNEPRPTTPIIFSTIENITADLVDEFPEANIKPEDIADEESAKILNAVIAQNIEACDFDAEYDLLVHDLLVGGWMVQETGWDKTGNNGYGVAFDRHVSNKNIMFDPHCPKIQDGRAVFKFGQYPSDWFRQHYPAQYQYMTDDLSVISQHHDDVNSPVAPSDTDYYVLIEAWFRFFDPDTNRYSVHMVLLAGGQVLENSCDVKPEGYFAHGEYPFIVTPLYAQKGSALGLGVVDMFKSAQQYSDKVDQIILRNALWASHDRMYYSKDAIEEELLTDYSKQAIPVEGAIDQVIRWEQPKPLPSHILVFRDAMRQSIKDESGSNDFSRGNVASGVTAASAITALQEMSSKRSRLEARRVHYGYKQAIRQMLEVVREFDFVPRQITITKDGQPIKVIVSQKMYAMLGPQLRPIEYAVSIKTAQQTKFTKLSNNQLILQFAAMFQGQIDPSILMEAMDFDGQEVILEKLRAATGKGIASLEQQVKQLSDAYQKMQMENGNLKTALNDAKNAITGAADNRMPDLSQQQQLQQQQQPM